jgi:hypothetical protein
VRTPLFAAGLHAFECPTGVRALEVSFRGRLMVRTIGLIACFGARVAFRVATLQSPQPRCGPLTLSIALISSERFSAVLLVGALPRGGFLAKTRLRR